MPWWNEIILRPSSCKLNKLHVEADEFGKDDILVVSDGPGTITRSTTTRLEDLATFDDLEDLEKRITALETIVIKLLEEKEK